MATQRKGRAVLTTAAVMALAVGAGWYAGTSWHSAPAEGAQPPLSASVPLAAARPRYAPTDGIRPPVAHGDIDRDKAEPAPSAAALTAVPTPAAENERLRTVLASSGPARRDDLERQGYDVMVSSLAALRSANVSAEMTDDTCHAAGCAATLAFADRAAFEAVQAGLSDPSMFVDWPGGRIHSPPVEAGGRLHARIILVRPDAGIAF